MLLALATYTGPRPAEDDNFSATVLNLSNAISPGSLIYEPHKRNITIGTVNPDTETFTGVVYKNGKVTVYIADPG
jgi:hypothetical protein